MKIMQELFAKYLLNQCSAAEVKELLAHFNIPEDEKLLRQLILESFETADAETEVVTSHAALDETYASIQKHLDANKGKRVSLIHTSAFRIAAALVIIAGAAIIFQLTRNNNKNQDSIVKSDAVPQEIAPGKNKGVLTLSDGSSITLETAQNGPLTQQGNSRIEKSSDGQLAYKLLNEKPSEVFFNSIATPRGGQYQVVLSDGTKVWLNAASSLRFPAAFSGSERMVELAGEAYFEVAKNASLPFVVKVDARTKIEVLGTHFNVTAYKDESSVNTTLLEGRVKLTAIATGDSRIMNPGEQAALLDNGKISINQHTDTDQVVAWKNGTFNFNNADLGTVLRQLSRWYDVDFKFEGPVPQRQFHGEIQRDLKLSQVLMLLEKNDVFCRLEGKTLIVRQNRP
jgi:transmembrane sensor